MQRAFVCVSFAALLAACGSSASDQADTFGHDASEGGADTVAHESSSTTASDTTTSSSGGANTTSSTTGPRPECGDGKIEAPESCEPDDLQGVTCEDRGYAGGGTLLCDAVTCTYDDSLCFGGTGGTSGTGGDGDTEGDETTTG